MRIYQVIYSILAGAIQVEQISIVYYQRITMIKQVDVEEARGITLQKLRLQTHILSCRYAITFGECSILHAGSQQIGQKYDSGFTVEQLKLIRDRMCEEYKIDAKLVNLSDQLPEKLRKQNEAAVLYLPGAAAHMLGYENATELLYNEQEGIDYDKKYYDSRRKKTLNKQARYNIVFGEEERTPSQDYKEYSVKAFKDLKYLHRFRSELARHFGKKAENLNAEGNKYFEQKSGIGFHGDSERKVVICLNLGKVSTLRYYWRSPHSSKNQYNPIDLPVKHGDVYIMSEKASGHDWRLRSKYRLVHAAGSTKYIGKN